MRWKWFCGFCGRSAWSLLRIDKLKIRADCQKPWSILIGGLCSPNYLRKKLVTFLASDNRPSNKLVWYTTAQGLLIALHKNALRKGFVSRAVLPKMLKLYAKPPWRVRYSSMFRCCVYEDLRQCKLVAIVPNQPRRLVLRAFFILPSIAREVKVVMSHI